MKIFDWLRIATKTLKSKWTILPIIGVAISTFCLCFAGATWIAVGQEKSLPYELTVSSEGTENLTGNTINKIAEAPDVMAVTAVLQFPISIKIGKYESQVMLTGIEAAYLQEPFSKGDVFPENSVMPYIVLNETACQQFIEENTPAHQDDIIVDWLNSGFSLQISDGDKDIPAKVCGILALPEDNDEQEAKAYTSLSAMKEIMRKSQQNTTCSMAYVRITNSGKAESISNEIMALGITVTNLDEELQIKWDTLQKEMSYLAVMGIFSLICSMALLSARRKIFLFEQKEAFQMLEWLGITPKNASRLLSLQALIIAAFGCAIGIVISLSVSSFLPLDVAEKSIFFLSIPLEVILEVTAICLSTSFLLMRRDV